MSVQFLTGDCRSVLKTLPDASVHCIVTSPPYYGLRSYLPDDHVDKSLEMGLEQSPDAYVAELVAVFREARRVLRNDGVMFLNLGDSYAMSTKGSSGKGEKQISNAGTLLADRRSVIPQGLKSKDLIGIPWRIAFALQADGWWLRQDIIWAKSNPMPESIKDRCTKAHEYVFLLSKSARYWYDAAAISETASTNSHGGRPIEGGRKQAVLGQQIGERIGIPAGETGRNRRSVWTIVARPYKGAHFATMPPNLAELCIKAGCPKDGTVLDPFAGVGTTGLVADRLGRNAILIELSESHTQMAQQRIETDSRSAVRQSALMADLFAAE